MRGHGLTALTPMGVIDLLGMAFMYVVPTPGFAWLTVVFAAWFLAQAAWWARGRVPSAGEHSASVRVSLIVMGLGMASMLVAMQFLMPPMPGM
ncbi:DUF5134 domain-containing protein [Sciscionella sediminilitoris]|uniref:DUF5134 domain-containing protein n=1 Tax=Sciscionella sediminilitoris TaxID=1445613 RepID=UPI0004DF0FE8|nr:DUF5134 domain-containing protein [Sciscionella sp. SE31]